MLHERGVISQWRLFGTFSDSDEAHRHFQPVLLVFEATLADTDGDGELTSLDANLLVVCRPSGAGMKVATPPRTQVQSFFFEADDRMLYILVRPDTNGDNRFTPDDETRTLMLPLDSDGIAIEAVSEETRSRMRELLGHPD